MADVSVFIDPVVVNELTNTPDGPTGLLLQEVDAKAAAIAAVDAPVMKPWNRSHWGKRFDPRYQYGPPGTMKASVHPTEPLRFNGAGQMYGGVNTDFAPTVFLERPAEQIHSDEFAYMSHTIDALEL